LEGDQIVVAVQDNGPGVPADIRERIWEPFFTTKPQGEGTGLGLAICREIISSLGGTLVLDPPGGGGASFSIRLPISMSSGPGAGR
jgi:two-component system NtrC family sensor kinase